MIDQAAAFAPERDPIHMTTDKKTQMANRMCYLFLIFLIGCLAGWLYEEVFYWFTEGMLRNRGILYGPWLPIYGLGALCIYAMKPVKSHPAALFFLCAGVTGTVEYGIGWISIHRFGLRLWDYRGLLGNIGGIVCLRSVISFAVLGLVFHYLIEPSAERAVNRMNRGVMYGVCLFAGVVFLADCILSGLFRTPITY